MTKKKGHVAAFISHDDSGCPCVFLHRVYRGRHQRYLTVEEIEDYLRVNTFLDLEGSPIKKAGGESGYLAGTGGASGLKPERSKRH